MAKITLYQLEYKREFPPKNRYGRIVVLVYVLVLILAILALGLVVS